MLYYYLKGDNENIRRRAQKQINEFGQLTITILTYFEALQGLEFLSRSPNQKSRRDAKQRLSRLEAFRQSHRVLPLSILSCQRAAKLSAEYQSKSGNRAPAIDILIAGIALENDCNVATENEKHFDAKGITVENWLKP
jgi:predicted nucleic acid-binding protein